MSEHLQTALRVLRLTAAIGALATLYGVFISNTLASPAGAAIGNVGSRPITSAAAVGR